jgi:hypothetical protein
VFSKVTLYCDYEPVSKIFDAISRAYTQAVLDKSVRPSPVFVSTRYGSAYNHWTTYYRVERAHTVAMVRRPKHNTVRMLATDRRTDHPKHAGGGAESNASA